MVDTKDNMIKSALYSVTKLSVSIDIDVDEYQYSVKEIEDELPDEIRNQINQKIADLKNTSNYLEALAAYNNEDLLNQMVLKSGGKFNLVDVKEYLEEIMEK